MAFPSDTSVETSKTCCSAVLSQCSSELLVFVAVQYMSLSSSQSEFIKYYNPLVLVL
jgi:hypothetical protein